MKLSLILLYAAVLGAQTYQIGSATDHCTGGLAYPSPQLRYGTFSCALPVAAPGSYSVRLSFIDPSVSVAGGRIFSVSVNGWQAPSLQRLDLIALGAVMGQPLDITVPAVTVDGMIRLALTTITRSAVLSVVTITPAPAGVVGPQGPPGIQGPPGQTGPAGPVGPTGPAGVSTTTATSGASGAITRQQCVGSGPSWNCAGLELWTVITTGATQQFAAVRASGQLPSLPPCPSAMPPCLQPAAITDAPLAVDHGMPADIADPQLESGAGEIALLPWNYFTWALVCGNSQGCYQWPFPLQK